jgi:predicted small secreted protein
MIFCVIFIIGVGIGLAFSILKTKEIMAARRDFLDKNKTLVYTNDHPT